MSSIGLRVLEFSLDVSEEILPVTIGRRHESSVRFGWHVVVMVNVSGLVTILKLHRQLTRSRIVVDCVDVAGLDWLHGDDPANA